MVLFFQKKLPKIKDGVYVINLDDRKIKGTHWVSLFIGKKTAIFFDSFGIEYIPQEIVHITRDKSITHNTIRIQDNDSIMCAFYCVAFVEYMLAGKTLLDYTNLFSPNDYENNDSNEIRTCNVVLCKQILNYLAKLTNWFGCAVSTYLYGALDCMHLSGVPWYLRKL